MSLPTLTFNKKIIIGIIDILCTFTTQLGLSKKIFYNKVNIIKGNLFTIKNMIQTIF